MPSLEKLPRFYYSSDDGLRLLPEWACFLMRLGQQIADITDTDNRYVVGLALPTRAFACALTTSGISLANTRGITYIDEVQKRFIRNLPLGTGVQVRRNNNRRLRGIIECFEVKDGKEIIKIRTAKKQTFSYEIDKWSSRITVSEGDINLPRNAQTGRLIECPTRFLESILGKEGAEKYILDSSFESLLVGKLSALRHEICNVPFFFEESNDSMPNEGCLQDFLRVRQFSGANKSYRSQCVSPANITPEKTIGKQTPPIVVFDGAIAYIKLGHKWRSAHQIVLLDRTERQFGDAIELLNQNYTYRLEGGFEFPIRIPNGIEMTVYRDSVQ